MTKQDSNKKNGEARKECTDIRDVMTARKKRGRTANASKQKGQQTQRNAANARERCRMRVLSKAFSRLKTTLPWVPADTKLSKLDTLRLAASYISHLAQLLAHDDDPHDIQPLNLTWPFSINSRGATLEEIREATDNQLSVLRDDELHDRTTPLMYL
ncbi:transcription factor 21-like [Saccoglossus kowalevskii]|uniref:Transcription factor 21-like n=1 Tax=Saccoglossus kowalevskii TaxID=10224 RepID=A0ABM0N052_SACKO|nr:PREDICTED: transcription factor 21-like [Saccoglossus kowalevskii]